MKTPVKITLLTIFILAVAGICVALYLYNLEPEDLKKTKPDYVMTSTELQKAFEIDEIASTDQYVNKIIEVTGEITSARPGSENSLSVTLKTGSDLSSVICTFPAVSDPDMFKAGEQVTIRGVCSGFLMDVLLNNCAIPELENK